jgi:hypothetical protein
MSLSGRLHCLIHHLVVLLHQKLRIVDHLAKAIWVKPSQCHWSLEFDSFEFGVRGEVKLLDLWSSQRLLLLEVQDA